MWQWTATLGQSVQDKMQRIQAQIVIEIINHSLTRGQELLDHLLNGIKMSALVFDQIIYANFVLHLKNLAVIPLY